MFQVFHLFQMHVTSVLFRCFKNRSCREHMLLLLLRRVDLVGSACCYCYCAVMSHRAAMGHRAVMGYCTPASAAGACGHGKQRGLGWSPCMRGIMRPLEHGVCQACGAGRVSDGINPGGRAVGHGAAASVWWNPIPLNVRAAAVPLLDTHL